MVADLRFGPSKEPVSPALYRLRTDEIDGPPRRSPMRAPTPDAVLGRIRASWRAIAPDVVFRAETARASLDRYAEADERQGRLFTFGAVAAVLIACVGLFGLSAFDAAQRQREIGVRKVLGASAGDVARLLAGRFLRPVLAANLIAWPLAFWAMRAWLSGFDQRIALGPLYFLAAAALAALIALATVAGQALRAARAEPARALSPRIAGMTATACAGSAEASAIPSMPSGNSRSKRPSAWSSSRTSSRTEPSSWSERAVTRPWR